MRLDLLRIAIKKCATCKLFVRMGSSSKLISSIISMYIERLSFHVRLFQRYFVKENFLHFHDWKKKNEIFPQIKTCFKTLCFDQFIWIVFTCVPREVWIGFYAKFLCNKNTITIMHIDSLHIVQWSHALKIQIQSEEFEICALYSSNYCWKWQNVQTGDTPKRANEAVKINIFFQMQIEQFKMPSIHKFVDHKNLWLFVVLLF